MTGLRAAAMAPFNLLDRYAQRSVDWLMFAVMRRTGKSKAAIRLAVNGVTVVCLVEMMLDSWRLGQRQMAIFYAIATATIGATSIALNGPEERLAALDSQAITGKQTYCFRWLWWFFFASNVLQDVGLMRGHADCWDFAWDVANLFVLYSSQTPPKAPDKEPKRALIPAPARSSS